MKLPDFAERLSRSAFLRFGAVGAAGYVVDNSVLFAMLHLAGADPYSGRLVSFLAAATFTWWGNRNFTFHEQRALGPLGAAKEWLRFLAANGVGGLVNLGLYASLVKFAPPPVNNPFLALPIGVLAGLVFNFFLSKKLVFRTTKLPSP